jgi:predicted thioesterase
MLEVGIKGTASVLVTEENSAKTMGSGTLDVFATPAMIALMERTCWTSIASELEEGWGSVGTALDVTHSAPTPLGVTVTCESELIAVEGRKLTFQVVAHDPSGEIGRGTHQRFLVDNAKFQKKADSKKG